MSVAPACGGRGDEEPDEELDESLAGELLPDAAHCQAHGALLQRRSATPPSGTSWRLLCGAGVSALALVVCAAAVGAWPHLQAMRGASGAAAPLPVTSLKMKTAPKSKCLGSLRVAGYGNGTAQLLLAGSNLPGDAAGAVEVIGDGKGIRVHMSGRAYFGASCTEGETYDPREYSSMDLLGRTLSFTVDLSGAECGCVAAMYMTPLVQSHDRGKCGSDYYCDANSVCGVRCGEMDVMEANTHAFHTTAHAEKDAWGHGKGLGGKWEKPSLKTSDYGPGSKHKINTEKPFQVSMELNGGGTEIKTKMQQGDHKLELKFSYKGLQTAFKYMAPIVSYWSKPASGDLKWFDGSVCKKDQPSKCSGSVEFSNFAISPPTSDSKSDSKKSSKKQRRRRRRKH